ncbi:hypothetical protein D1872_349110 [compost metagenome]
MFDSSEIQMLTEALQRPSDPIGIRSVGVSEQGQAHGIPPMTMTLDDTIITTDHHAEVKPRLTC